MDVLKQCHHDVFLLVVVLAGAQLCHAADRRAGWRSDSSGSRGDVAAATVALGAKLVEMYGDDGRFFEGPMWDPQAGKLYFTAWDGPSTQILRLE